MHVQVAYLIRRIVALVAFVSLSPRNMKIFIDKASSQIIIHRHQVQNVVQCQFETETNQYQKMESEVLGAKEN